MTIYAVGTMSVSLLLQENKNFIFDVLQKAMLFLEDFFGVKYPFKKYDHVFLRELNFGAM
jgi:aminopeptidase N